MEELLEQEKREQERQQVSSSSASTSVIQHNTDSLINEQDFENIRDDVINMAPQGLPAQGLLPLQLNKISGGAINQTVGDFNAPRVISPQQWRPHGNIAMMPQPQPQNNTMNQAQDPNQVNRKSVAIFAANLQPPPQYPPETIQTDQDRQIQIVYEQWLNTQNNALSSQLKYYETEVIKLRKTKKSLNSKQRQLKKTGNVLTEPDATELAKITSDLNFYQKQLENARKQSRQHTLVVTDYNTKKQSKMHSQMMPSLSNALSPAHMAPQSPLMSPSPSSQQSMMQSTQSPLGNQILQPIQSPLQSPSPIMPPQSPGPSSVNSILQSPSNQASNSGMSPYSSMQPSPRIGTPHSNIDESPFSPSAQG